MILKIQLSTIVTTWPEGAVTGANKKLLKNYSIVANNFYYGKNWETFYFAKLVLKKDWI